MLELDSELADALEDIKAYTGNNYEFIPAMNSHWNFFCQLHLLHEHVIAQQVMRPCHVSLIIKMLPTHL